MAADVLARYVLKSLSALALAFWYKEVSIFI